jgi:hypothetical protein
MEEKEEERPAEKRPYRKPRLKRVALRPEEAVLGGCKTASSSGPSGAVCEPLGPGSNCSTAGS